VDYGNLGTGTEDHGFGPTPSPSNGHDQEPAFSASKIINRSSLPEPRMGIIGDIEKIIKTLARTAVVKEKMCEWMQREVRFLVLIGFQWH
jgi:protein phosphatase 4 regulatory subunit 3